ncbi:MAG: tetratricopeptide repeat protein, partial [Candidatus Omnitrophica bacterium]|nr:tetratricopeptide repeat protein [Candidatus Omnitrophota bacterium]
VLGMLTKQITLTLPLMVLLLEFGFFSRRTKTATVGLLLAAAVLAGVIPLLYHFNASGILSITHENGNHPGEVVTSATYAMTQPRVVRTYLRLLAAPFGQTLLYDFPLAQGWTEPSTMASLLLLLIILGIAVAAWPRARLLAFGIGWFFITLMVEASVIPIRHVIFEHRTYLPSVGFFIVAAWALQRVISYRRARIAVLVAVLAVLSVLTIQRNRVWQSGVAMWTDVAAKSPANARVFYNLGYEYLKAGDKDAALTNFSKALLIDPDDELALINRSQLLLDGGEGQRALHDINNALRLNPRRADSYLNRGAILRGLGRFPEALQDFEEAQTVDPEHRLAPVNRALTLGNLGRFTAGLKVINDTITRHGESAKALAVRGALQMGMRDAAGAVESFSRGIALDPGDEELHRNRAQAWQVLGRFDRALEDLTVLIEKDPRQPDYYTQRAYVLTRLNRLNEALADYALAGRRAPALAEVYLERGKIYYKQGAYGQAAAELDQYLNRSPGAADAFMLRGLTHYELRDFQQALADFQRARDLGYSVDDAYFQQLKRVLGKI